MINTFRFILIVTCLFSLHSPSFASSDDAYEKTRISFKNFMTCELTRSDAVDHFKGDFFKIVMINLYDAVTEGDILIVTGAVKCWVKDRFETLYVAVGLKTLMGKEKVYYYLAQKTDFTILATELMNYPYKERCEWDRYWIDLK